jgi:hypothetical protein
MALATELIEQRSEDSQLSSARIARAETKRRPLVSHRVWDVASHLCLTGVLMLLIGEAWTRLPGSPQAIQYLYDEELSYRYAPNQTPTSRLLSLYGIDSPPMHIDERGFRNRGLIGATLRYWLWAALKSLDRGSRKSISGLQG